MSRLTKGSFLAFCLSAMTAARAGTPFFTDDPGFAASGWEFDFSSSYELDRDRQFIALPSVQANYSFTDHFQATLASGQALTLLPDVTHFGITDTDLHIKWRLIDEHGFVPALSIAPGVTMPTADRSRGLGGGQWSARIPVEIGKTFDKTYVYTELTYEHTFSRDDEPADDHLRFGAAVQYEISKKWTVGAEINGSQSFSKPDNRSLIANLGVIYSINDRLQIDATVGRTLDDESRGGPKVLGQVFLVWFVP